MPLGIFCSVTKQESHSNYYSRNLSSWSQYKFHHRLQQEKGHAKFRRRLQNLAQVQQQNWLSRDFIEEKHIWWVISVMRYNIDINTSIRLSSQKLKMYKVPLLFFPGYDFNNIFQTHHWLCTPCYEVTIRENTVFHVQKNLVKKKMLENMWIVTILTANPNDDALYLITETAKGKKILFRITLNLFCIISSSLVQELQK